MIKRWILYLACVLGALIFWCANQRWLSWLLLTALLWLPWFSLGVSLLPMVFARPVITCPTHTQMGVEEYLTLSLASKLPLPPFGCKLQLRHTPTGLLIPFPNGAQLPTDHSGELQVTCAALYVYDYLGLFRLPLKKPAPKSILVRPAKIALEPPRELERTLANSWQPKPGGGFAENHEMRLYRPGDSLNQIHWKLTAKTGKLTIRQPMIPRHGLILLTTDIRGSAEELDRKYGRLIWMGQHLLDLQLKFRIQALTGSGVLSLSITCQQELDDALDLLLRSAPAQDDAPWNGSSSASWHYHIGGGADEA